MRDVNLQHIDFRWVWAKVLPQVYDDTLSYYEQLCKLGAALDTLSTQCEDHFEEIYGALEIVNSEIASIESNYTTLEARVTSAEGNITNLITATGVAREELDTLKGGSNGQVLLKRSGNNYDFKWGNVEDIVTATGKWVFFGDSYENYGHWYERCIGCLGLTNNVDVYYAGASGHGFTVTGGKWIDDFASFISGRTDLSDFRHVVIGGGLNDASPDALANSGELLDTCMNAFNSAVRAAMPNATIHIGFFGSACSDSEVLYDRNNDNRAVAIWHYQNYGTYLGWNVLHNVEYIMNSHTYFASDKLHPNTYAGDRIGEGMAEALKNGSCSVNEYLKMTTAQDFDPVTDFNLKAYEGTFNIVSDGMSKCCLYNVVCISTTNAITIGTTELDCGEIPYRTFIRNSSRIVTPLIVSDGSTSTRYFIRARIHNRHLKITTFQLTNKTAFANIAVAANSRMDFGDLIFTEGTLSTM